MNKRIAKKNRTECSEKTKPIKANIESEDGGQRADDRGRTTEDGRQKPARRSTSAMAGKMVVSLEKLRLIIYKNQVSGKGKRILSIRS